MSTVREGPDPRGAAPTGCSRYAEVRSVRVSAWAGEAARDIALLSAGEQSRAASFRRRADRDRYLVAHTVLRHELGARLGMSPAAVTVARADCPLCGGPHGRPVVPGDPVHFSLSHSGGLVLLAFASAPVGVDVEELPPPAVAADVARSLHARERAELAAASPEQRPVLFARCWTRKEACLKGAGTGIAEGLSSTYVGTGAEPAAPSGWRIGDIALPGRYAAAWAVRRPPQPELATNSPGGARSPHQLPEDGGTERRVRS